MSIEQGDPVPGPPFLLDTHAWIWYLTASERLPLALRTTIETAGGGVWLSPISLWEVGMLEARGRVRLDGGQRHWIETALRRFPLEEAVLTAEVALRSNEIALGHRDPVDHLLAATALVYGLTLVTLDERLTTATWLPTRSS